MRLSWNEIRVRAADFAREWAGKGYEKGQTQLFYQGLFQVFGVPVQRVARFEEPVRRLGERRGFMDLFWKGVLLVEQKSAGRDLNEARRQALEYFDGLKNSDLPRFVLVSDFQHFELYDFVESKEAKFGLKDLPKHVERFAFIVGAEPRPFRDQDPVNIKAAEMLGGVHDALEASGYSGHDLEQFLVRLAFCLFSDDTGIFEPRESFREYLEQRTREDGSDLGAMLSKLFQVLDTPPERRQRNLDEDLARFPYVNGSLFHGALAIPDFDATMRARLIDACAFDWSAISPAIFGSLFQSVMDTTERRAQGAHYTTEKNILKVIEPLFLDGLRADFERIKARRDSRRIAELRAFRERLGTLRFFDPACGCGNFLVITYRELRVLEIDVIRELRSAAGKEGQLETDVALLSAIDVDQFYGIEIGEFPARIAETALWMMDHIMNNRLSLEFGQSFLRIPLRKTPHIHHADALEVDWSTVLAPEQCSFVLGNPPFIGSKFQTPAQREQVRRIAALGGTGGSLDYVTAWYIRAGDYVHGRNVGIGFVATNSITQGEQVAQLWPILFDRCGLEIAFAHRTFAWGSDARGVAHVHVVIIGLAARAHVTPTRRLYWYDDIRGEPHESSHAVITPYLLDGSALRNPHVVVEEVGRPINGLPRIVIGSKPIDGGHYIFTRSGRDEFVRAEPGAAQFLRPFIGAQEFLNGEERFILCLQEASPAALRELPLVRERVFAVKAIRLASQSAPTRALAATPTEFHVTVIPAEPYLVIPEVSSERRDYIPIGWLEPPVVPSNLVRVLSNATLGQFALLTSAMHMSWLRHIGGRLKSDYRYSIGLVYNTFPCPAGGGAALQPLAPLAQAVLDARRAHPESTLADLYDPDLMPVALRRAHQALDLAVDRLYRRARFTSDRERAEHLLGLYEAMAVEPELGDAPALRRRGRGRRP
jgi:hypothetical protein